jgi:hypothetical protein
MSVRREPPQTGAKSVMLLRVCPFLDELDELIESTIEAGDMTKDAIIADLELKITMLKEDKGDS